jgi:RNA polymerase sigma-70 factor (ECF subfamily)
MKNDDDIQLMLRFKEGDLSAYDMIFNKYKKEVLNTVYRIIGNKDDAEDLSQEVFLRIYNARKRYKPTSSFRTYLHKIIVNTCLSYLRRKKLLQFIHLDSLKDKDIPEISNPENTYEEKELKSSVKKAILKLPANQRTAIILKTYDNLSYDEIANVLNISPQAVKSLIFRARENLKKLLKDYILI